MQKASKRLLFALTLTIRMNMYLLNSTFTHLFVSADSYIVAFDTIVENLPEGYFSQKDPGEFLTIQ